jgi:hypothetical protein
MPDPREPSGRIVHGVRLAFNADLPHPRGVLPWEEREAGQQEMDMRIGAAVAAAERERAEAAEAVVAEVREVIGTYFTIHGNNTAASLAKARDLAEGIRQVLDRVPLGTQERSDEKEAGRG